MVLKDVSYLKRGNYIYIYGHWLNIMGHRTKRI